MFWRKPVFNAEHDGVGKKGNLSELSLMRFKAINDETTAMKVNGDR